MKSEAAPRRHLWLRVLSQLLGFTLVVSLGVYMYQHRDVMVSSSRLSAHDLALISLSILATWLVAAGQTTLMMRANGIAVGFRENLLVQVAAILGNYLPLRAGTALRFHYFKTVRGVDYGHLGGMSSARIVLLVLATALTGLVGLLSLPGTGHGDLWWLFSAVGIASLISLLGARWIHIRSTTTVGRLAERFLRGFRSLPEYPLEAAGTFCLILVQFAILGFRLSVCFSALGHEVSIPSLLLIAPTATLLSFVTITPGNLGLREWVIGALSKATGDILLGGVLAATLDRATLMLMTLFFGGPCLLWVLRRTARSGSLHVAGHES